MTKVNNVDQNQYLYYLDGNTYCKKFDMQSYTPNSVMGNNGSNGSNGSNRVNSSDDSEYGFLHKPNKCTDGKDDGKISILSGLGHFVKGVGKFFTSMFTDENGKFSLGQTLKTLAIGAAIAGVCFFTAGTAIPALIAGYFALQGGVGMVKSTVAAFNANTDEEVKDALENLGSNTTQTALSVIGFKKAGGVEYAKRTGHAIKNSYEGFKNAGTKGFANEARVQGQQAISDAKINLQKTGKQISNNWKKATEKSQVKDFENKQYKKKIESQTGDKKAATIEENKSYNSMMDKEGTFENLNKDVRNLETDMKTAKAKAEKSGKTSDKKAYNNAKAKYEGAKKALDQRKNSGEFAKESAVEKAENATKRAENAADKQFKTMSEKYNKMTELKEKMEAIKDKKSPEYTNAKTKYEAAKKNYETAKDNYETAKDNYTDAKRVENAKKGGNKFSFTLKQGVRYGNKLPEHSWLTIAAAGRRYVA